jgi:hypothetical protein
MEELQVQGTFRYIVHGVSGSLTLLPTETQPDVLATTKLRLVAASGRNRLAFFGVKPLEHGT